MTLTPQQSRWGHIVRAALFGAVIGALIVRRGRHDVVAHGPVNVWMFVSLGLWLALSIYWEISARNASAPASRESQGSRLFHLVMANGAMLLSFWPFPGWPGPEWHWFSFPRALPDLPWLTALGLAIGMISLLLALWARRTLGRNWSGAVTVKQDHELMRSGPYRLIRHPIYTGAIGMHVGTALISGRLQGLLAVALISIAYARKIGMEERVLSATFGEAFEDYRRNSWRLVPWIV